MTAKPLERLILDPAPKLGGNLDANKKNISNVEQLSFRTLYDDSLVGWWPFVAGSAADSSRYGNNGAFVGGANANNDILALNGSSDWVNVGSNDSLNFTNTVLYEQESQSDQVSSHQGVADDGTNLYTFDTETVYKRNRTSPYAAIASITLSAIKSAAGGDLDSCNHLGDGVAYGNYIYVPCEYYLNSSNFGHQYIVRLNKSDLSYSAHWNVQSQGHECAGIAADGTYLYVVSFADGSKIWKYSISNGTYVGYLSLSTSLESIQGITYSPLENCFFIMGGPWNKRGIHQVALNGTVGDMVYHSTVTYPEGLDYSQERMMILEDSSGVCRIVFLRKRSPLSGFTISAWVKPGSDITTEQTIVARFNYTSYRRQYSLLIWSGYAMLRVSGDPQNAYVYAQKTVVANKWQHVVGVCDYSNNIISSYVNAGTPGTTSFTSTTLGYRQDVGIGAILGADTSAPFNGLISDVRMYNRPLSAREIRALYLAGRANRLLPGITTSFIDNDGNTISVVNGVITAKTAP